MAFADVAANLRLNISDFSSKLSAASQQMGRFAKTMNRQYGDAAAALTKHNFELKDTARIVQGILVAQAFYGGARAIREATSAVWDFNKALDYAHVTYSALFGSPDLAKSFMSVLQEHSIATIFDYQDLADASKKMLAYGIEYKNLMFVMEGLTNLGAMSGDTAALDRISLALGQIYTRGKLTAEEMRQLANAYVPISDIIQEQFDLSPDDMGRVGDLNLPAGEVINAIVDYANERFASVGDAAMYTITGLQNKIVDTLKVLGVEMIAPISNAFKSFLAYVADGLESIRSAFASGGMGGVFEYLVPDPAKQQMIREFIANLNNLFSALVSMGVVASRVFGSFMHILVTAFNTVAPVIASFTNVLAAALNGMLNTRTGASLLRVAIIGAAAAFVLLRVHALGALVITAVTKAVMGLSKALLLLSAIITKHPIIALMAGLGLAIAGVAATSEGANSSLSKLFNTLSGAAGTTNGSDVFERIDKDIAKNNDAVDEFNHRFEEGADAAEKMADGIDGVTKAADKAKKKSGLLSFDEVYKLNEPSDASGAAGGTGGGIGDDITGIIDGLGALNDALIPSVPDFSEFFDDYTSSLFGGLEDSILSKITDAGIGAAIGGGIGAIIGAFVGNPILGAKIGALAGSIVGMFWEDLQEHIGLSDTQGVSAGLTGAIGAVIGGAIGGPAGSAIGVAISTLASGLTSMLWNTLAEKIGKSSGDAEAATVGSAIGTAVGTIIGAILGGPVGAAIGAAIGLLAGGVVGMFWEELKKALKGYDFSAVSLTLGGSIGAMLGFVTFGPAGALLGAGIGALAKQLIDQLWTKIGEMANSDEGDVSRASTASMIGTGVGAIIGMVLGGPAGAAIGAAVGALAGGIGGLFWDEISAALSNPNTAIGAGIGASIGAFFGPIGAAVGAVLGAVIGNFWEDIVAYLESVWENISIGFTLWWQDVAKGWKSFWSETKESLSEWWHDVKEGWKTWWSDLFTGMVTWLVDTQTTWTTRYDNIKKSITDWWAGLKATYKERQDAIIGGIVEWLVNTQSKWTSRYDSIKKSITDWWAGLKRTYLENHEGILGSIIGWLQNTQTKWTTKYDEIKKSMKDWWTGLLKEFGLNLAQLLGINVEKLVSIKTEWTKVWATIKTEFGKWWRGLNGDVKGWLDSYVWKPISDFFNIDAFWKKIKGMLDGIKRKISSWWSDITSIFSFDGISNAVSNLRIGSGNANLAGHASGGIFNREHVARFAEGNKAEAVIPLENASAMQPFVDAISTGILQGLLPAMHSSDDQNKLPPMYVGTLIADDRGIKQLYKKFEIIEAQEAARKGFA